MQNVFNFIDEGKVTLLYLAGVMCFTEIDSLNLKACHVENSHSV